MSLEVSSLLVAGVFYSQLYRVEEVITPRTKYNEDTGEPYSISISTIKKFIGTIELNTNDADDIDSFLEPLGLEVFHSDLNNPKEDPIVGAKIAETNQSAVVGLSSEVSELVEEAKEKLLAIGCRVEAKITLIQQYSY